MNKFDELLKQKGVSVFRVAQDLGMPDSSLYDFRNGKHMLQADKLKTLAEYFGVSVDYLLTGKTEIAPFSDPVAGEAAKKMEASKDFRDVIVLANRMTEESLKQLLLFARFLEQEGKR